MARSDCIAVCCAPAIQAPHASRHACCSGWRLWLQDCLLQGGDVKQLLQEAKCCCRSGPRRSSQLGMCWPRRRLQTGNSNDEACAWRAHAQLRILCAWGAGSSQGWRTPQLCAGTDLRACSWWGRLSGCCRGTQHRHSWLHLNIRRYGGRCAGFGLREQPRQGWLRGPCMRLCAHS